MRMDNKKIPTKERKEIIKFLNENGAPYPFPCPRCGCNDTVDLLPDYANKIIWTDGYSSGFFPIIIFMCGKCFYLMEHVNPFQINMICEI